MAGRLERRAVDIVGACRVLGCTCKNLVIEDATDAQLWSLRAEAAQGFGSCQPHCRQPSESMPPNVRCGSCRRPWFAYVSAFRVVFDIFVTRRSGAKRFRLAQALGRKER